MLLLLLIQIQAAVPQELFSQRVVTMFKLANVGVLIHRTINAGKGTIKLICSSKQTVSNIYHVHMTIVVNVWHSFFNEMFQAKPLILFLKC